MVPPSPSSFVCCRLIYASGLRSEPSSSCHFTASWEVPRFAFLLPDLTALAGDGFSSLLSGLPTSASSSSRNSLLLSSISDARVRDLDGDGEMFPSLSSLSRSDALPAAHRLTARSPHQQARAMATPTVTAAATGPA